MNRSALLLVGSHRRGRSTSAVLGEYLLRHLEPAFSCGRIDLRQVLKDAHCMAAMCDAVKRADVVILSFPLYVDTVPFCVTAAMEALYALHQNGLARRTGLVAIANSGFPEASHNQVALDVCHQFAIAAGLQWQGGLALGGGEALKGRPLKWLLPLTYPAMQALRWTATALAEGRPVPERARLRMARPIMPRRLFFPIATFRWYRAAYSAGAHRRMWAKHYSRRLDGQARRPHSNG
jgi:multimeric flavodoxin WrbA